MDDGKWRIMKGVKEGRWILASGSPRRRELLEQMGVEFEVRISGVEERTSAVLPEDVVLELSELKAEDVAQEASEGVLILGADTVVSLEGLWESQGAMRRLVR